MTDQISAILAQRGTTHGNFTDNSRISQRIKRILREEGMYDRMSPVQAEAVDMIVHKIARAVAGNANYADHWDDIAGYAKLVSERVNAPKPTSQSSGPGQVHMSVDGRLPSTKDS